jgi:hypothetical protein
MKTTRTVVAWLLATIALACLGAACAALAPLIALYLVVVVDRRRPFIFPQPPEQHPAVLLRRPHSPVNPHRN